MARDFSFVALNDGLVIAVSKIEHNYRTTTDRTL